jgi:hypothetical protein
MVKGYFEGSSQRGQCIYTDTRLLAIFQAADLINPHATQSGELLNGEIMGDAGEL